MIISLTQESLHAVLVEELSLIMQVHRNSHRFFNSRRCSLDRQPGTEVQQQLDGAAVRGRAGLRGLRSAAGSALQRCALGREGVVPPVLLWSRGCSVLGAGPLHAPPFNGKREQMADVPTEPSMLGRELVERAMEQLHGLHAASERAISQLEDQAIAIFDAADEETTREFMKATDIQGFEKAVKSFKANVLTSITGERSKKAIVRGRMFEKVGSVINVVNQGMQQELASLLALEAQRAEHRYKTAEDMLQKSRAAKAIEIDNAVKKALMEKEDSGNEIDSIRAFYKLQNELLSLAAQADTKKYPRSVVRKWKEQTEDISDDVGDAKEQVMMRHTELTAMVNTMVAQSADLDKLAKLYTEMENLKKKNGELSKRIVEMQDEQDDLRNQMAAMEADHNDQLSKLNEEWSVKMQGMSKNQHEAKIESLKSRMNDVENSVSGFDQTLVQLEQGMYQPTPDDDDKRTFNSVLDKRRKSTKKLALGDDALAKTLAEVEARLVQSTCDLVAVKTDCDNKLAALTALMQERSKALAAQMDKLSDSPSGCEHTESQYAVSDLLPSMQPKDAAVQVGVKPPKTEDRDAQTDVTGDPKPTVVHSEKPEGAEAEAQTEGYFVMEALAVREARQDAGAASEMPLVDPDALLKIEELMATLDERDAEISGLKVARETLSKMVANLRANQASPAVAIIEPEPEPEAITGLDSDMIAALRAELQRAYALIQTLEKAAPGSTPAVFHNLLKEHDFCLFCGAATGPNAAGKPAGERKGGQWHTDDEAELVLNGGAGFVKFWYGKGVPGHGGRSGGMPRDQSVSPSAGNLRVGPGVGPAGWGGAGANENSSLMDGGEVGSQRERRRPQTAELVSARSRSMEDVSGGSLRHSHSGLPAAQHSAGNASGGRRPHTAGSVISMGTSTGTGVGKGSLPAAFGLSTSAGDMSDMLRRSTVPSANAMSRRLKQASWSSGGSKNVPSFRPGSALAEPHPHALAANSAHRAARPGARRPATAEASLPPAGSFLPNARPAAGNRSRSAGDNRGRGQPSLRDDKHQEDKTGHMQRFLDSMQTVEFAQEDSSLFP